MKKVFIFLLGFLLIIGLFFNFKSRTSENQPLEKSQRLTVPVHYLKEQSFTYIQKFIGSVEAVQAVAVVPYLSAYLKEVHVQSGAEVQKGETLFLLDQKIPLAELKQAKEAVLQAKTQQENDQLYYERMLKTDKKAISFTELEEAKTKYESSKAVYEKALAAENQAQTIYNYTVIQAPISGWVGDITATIGEYLSPESPSLATIILFSPIRLVFSIPMSIYKGDIFNFDTALLQVMLSDGNLMEFEKFRVVHNNRVDKSTDSLSFFIDVPNDQKLLVPGAYIEVRFLYSKKGILVNKNWITLTSNGATATLLKEGIIQKQAVEIGASIGNQYWIKSGLMEGEALITVPISNFQIGKQAEGLEQ